MCNETKQKLVRENDDELRAKLSPVPGKVWDPIFERWVKPGELKNWYNQLGSANV